MVQFFDQVWQRPRGAAVRKATRAESAEGIEVNQRFVLQERQCTVLKIRTMKRPEYVKGINATARELAAVYDRCQNYTEGPNGSPNCQRSNTAPCYHRTPKKDTSAANSRDRQRNAEDRIEP